MRRQITRWTGAARRWLRSAWHWVGGPCKVGRCEYYRHYLAYGPAELTHLGYHAAVDRCVKVQGRWDEHLQTCRRRRGCFICSSLERQAVEWETRIRA